MAGKGNPGVTALIKQTPGAIGYVEYGYADADQDADGGAGEQERQLRKGRVSRPAQAALASVQLPANLRAWITDPHGRRAYPIVTYTWLLCYKKYKDPKTAADPQVGNPIRPDPGPDRSAFELGYIPLPANVVSAVSKALKQIS